MKTFLLTRKKTYTVTLSGSSGTANINVNGVNYLATFATSLTVTASNFVTAHAAALLAAGIVVTANTGVLTFTANVSGVDFTLSGITNASGNLTGLVANTKAQADFEIHTDLHNTTGNFTVLQILDKDKSAVGTGQISVEGDTLKKLVYSTTELTAYATSSDATLKRTEMDGTGSVTLRAEA
jgi:hypothetical protein